MKKNGGDRREKTGKRRLNGVVRSFAGGVEKNGREGTAALKLNCERTKIPLTDLTVLRLG